jgi:hypothetical protein
MRKSSPYLFGVGLALPLLALVAGLQVPTVSASPSHQDGTLQDATMSVNRALKGDRLPGMAPVTGGQAADRQGLQAPRATPRLPDGCEATVSAMTRSSLAQTPGRCIS